MSRELAELPHSWSRMKLGHLAAVPINNGVGESAQDLGENFLRYIRITDIKSLDLLHEERAAGVPLSAGQTALLEREDLVLAAVGATVGTAHFFTGDYPACFAGYLVRFRADQTRCDPRYVAWWSQSTDYWSQIKSRVVRSTIENFSAGRYRMLDVPVPPVEGQRRIADYLDRETATIDALIAKQVELMNRLRERRQAVIDRAFVSTSEIVILRRHLVLNDSGAWGEDPTGADDVAVLRSTEQTVDGYWAISDPALRTLSQTERQNTRLREGDLIVTKTSGSFKHVGKTTLVDNEVAEGGYGFGNFMQRLRLKSTMIPKFLWWFMRTDQARSWINLVATTSTGLMNLNGSTLGRMEVPLPSLVEQREIADHLDRATAKIDALIAKAERFIELAQERRTALITAAVTGQIEIPTED